MYLSKLEEKMLCGEFGTTIEKAMKILVAIGKIYNSEKLIPIENTQISGVSYKTIGDAGIYWLSKIKGVVKVPSFLNPCGIDLKNPFFLSNDIIFVKKQLKIINLFKNMGVKITCSCTPYYIPSLKLKFGNHLSWSESSAVIYVNSIYGCRTNREGGPSAIASALIGKTPYYGLHISENRAPKIKILINEKINNFEDIDYNILGLIIGRLSKTNIPLILIKENPSLDNLKQFGASMAASGCVPLYHIPKITAENRNYNLTSGNIESIEILKSDLEELKEKYIYKNLDSTCIDLIILGCPHCSKEELEFIEKILDTKKIKKDLFIFISRNLYYSCYDLIRSIKLSNAKIICDTCIVVSKLCENYNSILVNSGKAYMYIPTMCKKKVFLGTTIDCLMEALKLN